MTRAIVSRWGRRFVAAGAVFLVAWNGAIVTAQPRRATIALGLFGVVLTTLFGKAYPLLPAYFDRQLAVPLAPAFHFPVAVLGTLGLAAGGAGVGPPWLDAAGASLWAVGVALFVTTIGATILDNPTGAETGTAGPNVHRRRVDRLANAAMPVGLAYLLVGSYAALAGVTPLPPLVDGYPPRATHLLAAGVGALFVFAVGFRLFPRFLNAEPPRRLVPVVLVAGAVGPILVAVGLPAGPRFHAGAALEGIAVVGFAAAYVVLFARAGNRRVGYWAVLAGVVAGAIGTGVGVWFAFGTLDPTLVDAHRRLNLLGLLGLTVVGAAYGFHPPSARTWPGVDVRTAGASIGLLAVGLAVETAGTVARVDSVASVGTWLVLAGSVLYAFLVLAPFAERRFR